MPRKKIRGTGMTAREVEVYDLEAGESPPVSDAHTWNRAIEDGGGIFGAVSLQAARTCEHIIAEAGDEIPTEDSPQGFAQTIAKHIAVAKRFIREDNADLAARFAFLAGFEWARATTKWGSEPDWQRGVDILAAAREGHEAVHGDNTAKKTRWRAMVDDVESELANGAKKTIAYRTVAKKHGVSSKTVQRALGYLKKN